MPDTADFVDALGRLRYGVGTNEKEGLAAQGSLPGSPHDSTPDKVLANRHAAGYLFGKTHPDAAPTVMPIVSFLRALFGDSPELQAQAVSGMNQGRVDSQRPEVGSFLRGLRGK